MAWKSIQWSVAKWLGGNKESKQTRSLTPIPGYAPDEWEIPVDKLIIGDEIAEGGFGKVYRGMSGPIRSHCGIIFTDCVIKTVNEDASMEEKTRFLSEASVLKQCIAPFIVQLYGVVSVGNPLVVMEVMEKGNLRDHLKTRRPDAPENVDNLPVPTDDEITEWAAQIADGMAYLHHLKVAHKDLAAQNLLMNADNVVKIAGFGNGVDHLRIRWMSPQSLKTKIYTRKNDAWAFGVVLFEIVTLAAVQPYQGLSSAEIFNNVEATTRKVIERPPTCSDFWYSLMLRCWEYAPRQRPTFRRIAEDLGGRASDRFRQKSWVLNEAPEDQSEEEFDATDDEFVFNEVRGPIAEDS